MNRPSITIGPVTADHLSLEVLEIAPPDSLGAGDVQILVSIHCNGLAASGCKCWIFRSELNNFLDELRALEESRVGSITLNSMCEFQLTIASEKAHQWPVVSGMVTTHCRGRGGALRSRLEFSF